jgi:hypothetical protein
MNDRYETLVRYHDRQHDIVLEAAQTDLSYGITTVRDSYGMLRPLVAVRDRIAAAAPSARAFSPPATSSAGAVRIRSASA